MKKKDSSIVVGAISLLILQLWVLVGCQSLGYQAEHGKLSPTAIKSQRRLDPAYKGQVSSVPQRAAEYRRDSPAVEHLLDVADQQVNQGQLLVASATIERALRIGPRSTKAYLHLAKLRLKQNRFSDAEQLALKALLYIDSTSKAARNSRRAVALWRVVETARLEQGDVAGAEKARARLN